MRLFFFLLVIGCPCVYALEDPTKPQTLGDRPTAGSSSVPSLTSILFSADRKWAVVDGEVVSEGAEIAGYEIVDIRRRSVVMVRNERQLLLSLDQSLQSKLEEENLSGTDI